MQIFHMVINELGFLAQMADSGSGAGNVQGERRIFHQMKIFHQKIKKEERKEAFEDQLSHAK